MDRFLAIPFFNSFSGKPLVDISDDRADAIIKREFAVRFSQLTREKRESLYKLVDIDQHKHGGVVNWHDVHAEIEKEVRESYYDFYAKKYYRHYGNTKSIAAKSRHDSTRYLFFKDVRRAAQYEGVLKFEDAFSIAFAYSQMLPEIKDVFATRFKYVFIDEVQDSSQLQLALLEKVFDRQQIVVQRFGDPYQAIYNTERDCVWAPINPLPLNRSKRFGSAIANVLRFVCVEDNRGLDGSNEVHSVKPVMLVYTDGKKVLPAFAKLLREKTVNGVRAITSLRNYKSIDLVAPTYFLEEE